MTLAITKDTFVRYERYGGPACNALRSNAGRFIYLINRRNQNKTKITDENEAFLFWLVVNGKPQPLNDKIREWIARGYLEEAGGGKPFLRQPSRRSKEWSNFESEFNNKPVDYASRPLLATLGITSFCNFKCLHCGLPATPVAKRWQAGNDSGRRDKGELSAKEILRLLKELGDLQILKLTLTGGEPLLKENFFEILRFAAERIPRVTVTSNGSLIDKKTSRRLKGEGVSALKISIDGTEDFHDKNRGYRGAYQKAIRAIRCLMAEGLEVRVQSTLMKGNAGSILELMPILSGLGVGVHSIVPVSPIGRSSGDLMLGSEEYRDYVLKVNRAAKEISVSGEKPRTIFEIRPAFGLGLESGLEVLSTKYKCEALKTTLEITPTGKVVPCSFFPVSIGDVRRNSLQDIWISGRAHRLRRVFDERFLGGKCRSCQIKKECGGGCLANSYAIYKKYHLGDVYCWR